MRYLVGFVCVLAVALSSPLSASAQAGEEGATSETNLEEPSSEPVPEEPALQLKVDDAGVEVMPTKFGLDEYEEPESPEQLQKRIAEAEQAFVKHRGGLIVSSVILGLGIGMLAGGAVWVHKANAEPPPGSLIYIPWGPITLTSFGVASVMGGFLGTAVSGSRMRARKRELRELRQAHYERVEADTSDDAFLIIVTRKYKGGELTGATVLIKHKESGQYAIPYVDAVEIDTLDQVIREHKAKLLSGE